MSYFNGVAFVCGGYVPASTAVYTRRFEDYYGIQYSQDGEFAVAMNEAFKQTVTGAWVLITRPGPLFRYGALPDKQRLHAFVCFKGPRVNDFIKSGLLPINARDPLIRITKPERFLETLRQLVVMLNPLGEANYHRAVHKLEDLLLQLHEQTPEQGAFPEYWRAEFVKLTARINATPGQAWDFRSIAGTMNISYPHFRRLFRQHSGLAPGQFVMHARLGKAASRLITTNQQIKIFAEQCGFSDSFYFSRLFKKHYHLSPLRYRREFRR